MILTLNFDSIEIPSTTRAGRFIPSLGLIVGIIIGVLLLVFLGMAIVAALFCLVKRRETGREKQVKACYGVGKLNNHQYNILLLL